MHCIHETILHINLSALERNFNYLTSQLNTQTQTIAVIKAFAYGLGDIALATELEKLGVDYFWVADFEEGVSLRKAGIKKQIIIANPGRKSLQEIVTHKLEPVIYNNELLNIYGAADSDISIHLKFNTGMNRYGFDIEDIDFISQKLEEFPKLKVTSVCSHLAASGNEKMDNFTQKQIALFNQICNLLKPSIPNFNRHLLNSNGVLRFPEHQMEMVRLGVGLYGASPNSELEQICRLESTISQVRTIRRGASVGYQQSFMAEKEMQIAVIPIGYADGLNRKLGNGCGRVLINGKECPIIGELSMDSLIADVSKITVFEGDKVTIFSSSFSITKLAKELDTIPYEVLASLNRRIKRIYYRE